MKHLMSGRQALGVSACGQTLPTQIASVTRGFPVFLVGGGGGELTCRCPFSPMSCGGRTWSPSFTAAGGDAPRARCLQSCGGCRRPGTLPGGECGQRDPLWVTCIVSRELEGALGRLCEAHVWKGEAEPSGQVTVRLASGVHLPVSSHIRGVLSSEVTAGIAGPIQPPYIFLCDPFLSEAPVSPPPKGSGMLEISENEETKSAHRV